jgi:hypothetical protein
MPKGYIYVMTNPAHKGTVKIGKTTKDPFSRAAELSCGTGVIGKFEVYFQARCSDIDHAESLAHHALKKERVQKNREFFAVEADRAKRIILNCIASIDIDDTWVDDEPQSPESKFKNNSTNHTINGDASLSPGIMGFSKAREKTTKCNEWEKEQTSSKGSEPLSPLALANFHTRDIRSTCASCGAAYSQTVARGESLVRCPVCSTPRNLSISW